MNQQITQNCSLCGTPLDSRLGPETCPRCLLAAALQLPRGEEDADTDPHSQPIPEHLGRYVDRKSHAEGGMGRVFIARDRSLGRKIAIKELRAVVGEGHSTALPDTHSARFLREAQITAMLEHPAITPIHELGVREDGTLYYTMKLVQGATLSELIVGADSVGERLRYVPNLIAVAHAVAYAHSRGVIHRDIKPENIVVGEYGETVLVDWGVAKVDSDDSLWLDVETRASAKDEPDEGLTLPGSILGTPAYMPPEQALGRNRDLDGRADVYALGAVLYSLLSGERPFTGGTATEILQKVVRNEPVPIRKRAPRAPKELVAICEKAMSKDRDDRFESAQSFTEDLTRYQEGLPVRSYRYTLPERAARLILRHRAITSAVFLAVVLVGVVSAGYSVMLRSANIRLDHARQAESHERILAELAAEELRKENYVVSIRIAQKQIEEGRFHAAERTLFNCPVDLRHWEWGYLLRLCHEEVVMIRGEDTGNRGSIYDAHLSPNNRYLLIDRPGTRIKTLTDLQSGETVWTSKPLDGWRYCNGFSRDGTLMSVAISRSEVALLRVPTGEIVSTFSVPDMEIHSFIISPDNKYTAGFAEALGGKRRLLVWKVGQETPIQSLELTDAQDRTPTFHPETEADWWAANFYTASARVLGFSLDGGLVYFADEWLKSLDVKTGAVTEIAPSLKGSVVFAFDAQKAAIYQGDGQWALWNVATDTMEYVYDLFQIDNRYGGFNSKATQDAILTPNADALILRGLQRTTAWARYSLKDRRLGRRMTSHVENIARFSVSQDGRYLVSTTLAEVCIWALKFTFGHPYYSYAGDARSKLQRPESRRWASETVFSEDSEYLFAPDADGGLQVFSLPQYREVRFWQDHLAPIYAIAFTNDQSVITGSTDGQITIRNLEDEQSRTIFQLGVDRSVIALAVSPDQKWVACSTENTSPNLSNEVVLYSRDTFSREAIVWSSQEDIVVSEIAFSPNGRLLMLGVDTKKGGYGSHTLIFDAETLLEVARIEEMGEPINFDFSPDGKRMLISAHQTNPILYDLENFEDIWRLEGFRSMYAVFHPSGERFYAVSETRHGTIFSTDDARELVAIPDCGIPAAWSSDGKTLYTPTKFRDAHSRRGRIIRSLPTTIRNFDDLRTLQLSRYEM